MGGILWVNMMNNVIVGMVTPTTSHYCRCGFFLKKSVSGSWFSKIKDALP